MYVVSQDFMRAMGMRVIQGRGFTEQDGAGRPPVLLINRKLARSGFLGPNPVGIRVYPTRRDVLWEVIGVVDDVRQHGLDEEPREQIFVDVRQFPSGNPNVYYAVRTDGDPIAVASTIRTMARQLDPRAMVDNVATMDQLVANSVSRRRLYAVLLGVFASVAMILAAVGLFGVLAYVVASRTREIGVRVALGAQRAQVIALVLRQTAALTAIGVIAGVAAAAALSRYLEGLLFGVTPLDLTTFALVIIAFGTISAFASYVPARRATGVDPMVALRSE
jgi:predicted permease